MNSCKSRAGLLAYGNERASYNGSIEAFQASDVGSIPIARSINPDDSVDLTRLSSLNSSKKRCVLDGTGQLDGRFDDRPIDRYRPKRTVFCSNSGNLAEQK